uniref:Transcriptional adapter 3-B n=1 Tax=Cacopsylla melanoneura TaxID=428564 RepID=A0A8D8UTM7_9HEMI
MKTKEKDLVKNSTLKDSSKQLSGSQSKEEDILDLPNLHTVDRKKLPCFQKILSGIATDAVGMNEINNLEAELEMLLSKVALRHRALKRQTSTNTSSEKNKKKKGKTVKKKKEPPPIHTEHRNLTSGESLFPELKSLMTSHTLPTCPRPEPTTFGAGGARPPHTTMCGKVLPDNTDTRNEATSKFCTFVEPYVAEFVNEDLTILDDLIAKYDLDSGSSSNDIPPLGPAWAAKWGEGDLAEEKRTGGENCKKLRKPTVTGSDTNQENVKDILNRAEQICTSSKLELPDNLVERIVDPDFFPDDTKNNNTHCLSRNIKEDESDVPEPKRRRLNEDEIQPGISNHNSTELLSSKHLSSLDARLRRGLSEQFQVKLNKADEQSDEILVEIIKCQEEVRMLAAQNRNTLESLRRRVEMELERQKWKRTLSDVEEEVIEITKKYTSSRKIEPNFTAQSMDDGVKILDNRRFKLNNEDTNRILNILQKRNRALSALHGGDNTRSNKIQQGY